MRGWDSSRNPGWEVGRVELFLEMWTAGPVIIDGHEGKEEAQFVREVLGWVQSTRLSYSVEFFVPDCFESLLAYYWYCTSP